MGDRKHRTGRAHNRTVVPCDDDDEATTATAAALALGRRTPLLNESAPSSSSSWWPRLPPEPPPLPPGVGPGVCRLPPPLPPTRGALQQLPEARQAFQDGGPPPPRSRARRARAPYTADTSGAGVSGRRRRLRRRGDPITAVSFAGEASDEGSDSEGALRCGGRGAGVSTVAGLEDNSEVDAPPGAMQETSKSAPSASSKSGALRAKYSSDEEEMLPRHLRPELPRPAAKQATQTTQASPEMVPQHLRPELPRPEAKQATQTTQASPASQAQLGPSHAGEPAMSVAASPLRDFETGVNPKTSSQTTFTPPARAALAPEDDYVRVQPPAPAPALPNAWSTNKPVIKQRSATHQPKQVPEIAQEEPQTPQAPEEEEGFWARLSWGASKAIGLISDLVVAINAESESDGEAGDKDAGNLNGGSEEGTAEPTLKDQPVGRDAVPKEADGDEEEQKYDELYAEYVAQYCAYLGVDTVVEPHLIIDVDGYLKRQLPEGWSVHMTDANCDYGAGYTYYMYDANGHTQWIRPDEEAFLRQLVTKMKRPPIAGSRLFFTALRDRSRRARWAVLEEQVGHLTANRPVLRALPEGAAEPPPPAPGLLSWGEGVIHVALQQHFPMLHPAAVEAFAAYFGLGPPARFGIAELRQLWVMKLAALCPVPDAWEFRFDETSLVAVFVDIALNTASKHHPQDAFFAGLLERMLARHRSMEAVEASRAGKPVSFGWQAAFFVEGTRGEPYWQLYGSTPSTGSKPCFPWSTSTSAGKPQAVAAPMRQHLVTKSDSQPPASKLPALPEGSAASAAVPGGSVVPGDGAALRDASRVPALNSAALRTSATGGTARPGGDDLPVPAKEEVTSAGDDEDQPIQNYSAAAATERMETSPPIAPASSAVKVAVPQESPTTPGSTVQGDHPSEEVATDANCVPNPGTSECPEDAVSDPARKPVVAKPRSATTCSAKTPGVTVAWAAADTAGGAGSSSAAAVETASAPNPTKTMDVLAPAVAVPLGSSGTVSPAGAPPPPMSLPPPTSLPPALPVLASQNSGELPHWTHRGGSWRPRGTRLSSDEETGMDEPHTGAGSASGPKGRNASTRPSAARRVDPPGMGSSVQDRIAHYESAASGTESAAEAVAKTAKSKGARSSRRASEANPTSVPPPPVSMPPPPVSVPPPPTGVPKPASIPPPPLAPAPSTSSAPAVPAPPEQPLPASENAMEHAELAALANRLHTTHKADVASLCEILEQLERTQATVAGLRQTQLGLLTQAYKDHPDRQVRTIAKRLRKSWKSLIQTSAGAESVGEADHGEDVQVPVPPPPPMAPQAEHRMAPPTSDPTDLGTALPAASSSSSSMPQPIATSSATCKPEQPVLRLLPGSQALGAAQAKRKRAELTANLQWLCRLFLETREQLYAAHEGGPHEDIVCKGIREDLDIISFRELLERALGTPQGQPLPRGLVRFLRAFIRRALHDRQRSALGHQLHAQFVTACAGHGNSRAFVLNAVPKVLALLNRLIEKDRRGASAAEIVDENPVVADGLPLDDPWADSGTEDKGLDSEATAPPGWEVLETALDEGAQMAQLEEEAQEFLEGASVAWPTPLQLPGGNDQGGGGGGSGSTAPRGRPPPHRPGEFAASTPAVTAPASNSQSRIPARPPFISGDPALVAKVAKAPLPNVDGLISCLVPGADIATEGVLHQMADDELIMLAYAMEQITEAASKRLIRELEVRDDLKSTCMHRREYLQILEGPLGH